MGERTTYMEVELGREGLELISVVTKLGPRVNLGLSNKSPLTQLRYHVTFICGQSNRHLR